MLLSRLWRYMHAHIHYEYQSKRSTFLTNTHDAMYIPEVRTQETASAVTAHATRDRFVQISADGEHGTHRLLLLRYWAAAAAANPDAAARFLCFFSSS